MQPRGGPPTPGLGLANSRRFSSIASLGCATPLACPALRSIALRHSVATPLVGKGEILQAQARLGHADSSTTLREFAYALPMTDRGVADAIDRHLNEGLDGQTEPNRSWQCD